MKGSVEDLRLSGEGNALVVLTAGEGRVWDLAQGRPGVAVKLPPEAWIREVSARGRYVATELRSGNGLKVWDATTGRELVPGQRRIAAGTVAFSAGERWMATANDAGSVQVWHMASGREVARIPHAGANRSVAFSPDERFLATGGEDGVARVWEVATAREVSSMPHRAAVWDAQISPDGRYLLTRCGDDTVWVWAWRTRDLVEEAGRRVARNFTRDEWQRYLPDEPYRETFARYRVP